MSCQLESLDEIVCQCSEYYLARWSSPWLVRMLGYFPGLGRCSAAVCGVSRVWGTALKTWGTGGHSTAPCPSWGLRSLPWQCGGLGVTALPLVPAGVWGACTGSVGDWGSQHCPLSQLGLGSHHSTHCRSHLGVWENLGDFESETCLHGEDPVGHFRQDVKWQHKLLPYAQADLKHIHFPAPVV